MGNFIAARQKDMATSSVAELVQAVKMPGSVSVSESRPRALSESMNRRSVRKSGGGGGGGDGGDEAYRLEAAMVRRKSESAAASTGRRRRSMERINELPETKPKKYSRRSFMGYDFFFFIFLGKL